MGDQLRVLDLFSGIGGISLGLERTGGFRTVAFCEIDPFCREVLAVHWPEVPIYEDVRGLRGADLVARHGTIDTIVGGFPCQDISCAGKGAGIEGARSGLWSEMYRIVCELRPRWVLAENVPALRTRGVDRVYSDLEVAGYSCWPFVVGACDVGAPHRRKRVWFVAHRDSKGAGGVSRIMGASALERKGERSQRQRDWAEVGYGGSDVGEPTSGRSPGPRSGDTRPHAATPAQRWPARPGCQQYEWEEPRLAYAERGAGEGQRIGEGVGLRRGGSPGGAGGDRPEGHPQLPLGSPTHGLPERLVRRANREALKAVGNSVVPQVVEVIGRAMLEAEEALAAREVPHA